jgi:hypothetical protein
MQLLINNISPLLTYRPQLYDPSHGLYGWTLHVQWGSGLLEKLGPPTPEKPIDRNLYRRVRLFAVSILALFWFCFCPQNISH